jgi:hypothetical protein
MMRGRTFIFALLGASLALLGHTSAYASHNHAVIAGAVVGAVVGGSIVANSRYGYPPVHVEIGAPPPRVVYYEPYPVYYQPHPYYRPYPVIVGPHYKFRHHHHKHHYRWHRGGHPGYYAPRW